MKNYILKFSLTKHHNALYEYEWPSCASRIYVWYYEKTDRIIMGMHCTNESEKKENICLLWLFLNSNV